MVHCTSKYVNTLAISGIKPRKQMQFWSFHIREFDGMKHITSTSRGMQNKTQNGQGERIWHDSARGRSWKTQTPTANHALFFWNGNQMGNGGNNPLQWHLNRQSRQQVPLNWQKKRTGKLMRPT
eukprot:EG_transcript_3594